MARKRTRKTKRKTATIKLGGKKIKIRKGLTTSACKRMGYKGVTCGCLKQLKKRVKKDKKWSGRIGIAIMGLRKKGVRCKI